VNDRDDQWTKEEYLAHLAAQRKREIEESEGIYRLPDGEITSESPSQKIRRLKRLIGLPVVVFVIVLAYFGEDIQRATGITWFEDLWKQLWHPTDPKEDLGSLFAPAGENPARIYKWKTPLKVHVLSELQYSDRNALNTIVERLAARTPLMRWSRKSGQGVKVYFTG